MKQVESNGNADKSKGLQIRELTSRLWMKTYSFTLTLIWGTGTMFSRKVRNRVIAMSTNWREHDFDDSEKWCRGENLRLLCQTI